MVRNSSEYFYISDDVWGTMVGNLHELYAVMKRIIKLNGIDLNKAFEEDAENPFDNNDSITRITPLTTKDKKLEVRY